jgi:hypothetical protein
MLAIVGMVFPSRPLRLSSLDKAARFDWQHHTFALNQQKFDMMCR